MSSARSHQKESVSSGARATHHAATHTDTAALRPMDPEARRHACMELRAKLSRDTGVYLAPAVCEQLLGCVFLGNELDGDVEGEVVSLQSHPGRFYVGLGEEIGAQTLPIVLPNHSYLKLAWWCFRQAAEHENATGTDRLGECYYTGRGVTEDWPQAGAYTRSHFRST